MIRNWQENDIQLDRDLKNFESNVISWIKIGVTSPELCFVWAQEGQVKGGIAYGAGGNETAQILDFSLNRDSFHLGAELLNESEKQVFAKNICYHLYNDSDEFGDYKKCFLDAGFSVTQEKLNYRFSGASLEHKIREIQFRSYANVGEEEFAKAIALVTQETLDSNLANSAIKYGESKAAEIFLNELKEIDFQADMWMLAYDSNCLIGLVIPQIFTDDFGGINYIGVVPTQRGKGYVNCLLNKGTQLLLNQGVSTVIADIDVSNFPIKNALERTGYKFFHEEVVLVKEF